MQLLFKTLGINSFANLGLLLLVVLTASTGILILFRIPEFSNSTRENWILAIFAILELMYLWMVRGSISEKKWKNNLSVVAIKMQLQATFTTFFVFFLMVFSWLILDFFLGDNIVFKELSHPDSALQALFTILTLALTWSLIISIWQIHSLRSSQANFEEIACGNYKHRHIHLATSKEFATTRLEYYLAQLSQPNTSVSKIHL